jgi:[acyl-carrier-protein] S-malonyltransferase
MFPGQSSRDSGMFDRLFALRPENRERVKQASELLGRDLLTQYHRDNPEAFARNRDVQVGVFLANQLFLETLEAQGITAEYSLGLSLGEYNHLVHIGCLDFESALRLVDARGAAYDRGAELCGGAMASCFPIELDELLEVVERARNHGSLDVGNLNSPQQHVISGEHAAVNAAIDILEEEFSIDPVVIEQRVPMHSSRFRPVAELLQPALSETRFARPLRPYLPNVLAELLRQPDAETIVGLLLRHVYEPVRWRESIELLCESVPGARFIEVGPRGVLYNLLSPRWKRVDRFKTDSAEDVTAAFSATCARLRDAA